MTPVAHLSATPNRVWHAPAIALLALLLSLVFHSPRLWIFVAPVPGSTYWDRGLQFMQQCDSPLGEPLEDAGLTWRLAPVLLAKGLGLHGFAVFMVPWLGLFLMLTLCAWIVRQRTGDHRLAVLATALFGTTTATLTVTGWLGMNDAWYAAALLAIAFVPARWALLAAVIAGPWVDERFVLGLPLALCVRRVALGKEWRPAFSLLGAALGLAAYAVIRGLNLPHLATNHLNDYYTWATSGAFRQWLPWTSLGWFMGLRMAWALVIFAVVAEAGRSGRPGALGVAACAVAPMAVITLLAADTGRTTTMLVPLLVLGVDRLAAGHGVALARRVAGMLLAANLLMPAMHVTHKNGDIINSLPVEIARWLGQP